MKTIEQVEAAAGDLESDLVERKASASDGDRIQEAITAFANDLPDHRETGLLLIGVDDRTGDPAGLTVDDELLLRLAHFRDNGKILPIPSMEVYRSQVGGTDIAVIEVQPSTIPPVSFRGRVWIRVGPRRAIATKEEETRLAERRRLHTTPFDVRAVPGATTDDLDLGWFQSTYLPGAVAADVLEQNERTRSERLVAVRFMTADGLPSTAGILTAGVNPLEYLPNSYVQFLKVDGDSLADDLVDEKRFSGRLDDIIRETERQLAVEVRTSVDLRTDDVEERGPDYPLAALQQLLRNAVMHRTYEATNAPIRVTVLSDRIEIQSPGGLFGLVTPENVDTGATDYRNPTIAEALRNLGFVQRFGAGLPTVRRTLADNGNPPLQIDASGTHVLVTIRKSPR